MAWCKHKKQRLNPVKQLISNQNGHLTYEQMLISDVQTKLLHDNAFDQLMNYLTKDKLLSNLNIGDFIEINDEK